MDNGVGGDKGWGTDGVHNWGGVEDDSSIGNSQSGKDDNSNLKNYKILYLKKILNISRKTYMLMYMLHF